MKKLKISILLVSLILLAGTAFGGPPDEAPAEPNYVEDAAVQEPAMADSNDQAGAGAGEEQKDSVLGVLFFILIVLVGIAILSLWGKNYIYINEETVRGHLKIVLFLMIFSLLNHMEWEPWWFAWAVAVLCFAVYVTILISRNYESKCKITDLNTRLNEWRDSLHNLKATITKGCIDSLKEKIKSRDAERSQAGHEDVLWLFTDGISALFDEAIRHNKSETFSLMLEHVKILPLDLNRLYFVALNQKSLECLKIITAQPGFDKDWKSPSENTGLHLAILLGIDENTPETVRVLLENGVNVNAINDFGNTALLILAGEENGDLRNQLISQLIGSSADTEVVNNGGQNALDVLKETAGIAEAYALLSEEKPSPEPGDDKESLETAAPEAHEPDLLEVEGPSEAETEEPKSPNKEETTSSDTGDDKVQESKETEEPKPQESTGSEPGEQDK